MQIMVSSYFYDSSANKIAAFALVYVTVYITERLSILKVMIIRAY